MVSPGAVAAIQNLDPNNLANTTDANSGVSLDKIGGSSDIMSDISNDYDFIKAITENKYTVDSVEKTLKTQRATDEFSYETELVSKVASVTVSGINTLVKMQ